MLFDDAVDGSPVRQSSNIPVIDEIVYLQFAREVVVFFRRLFGVVVVDSIEVNATLMTPVNGFLKQVTLTNRPQYQLMPVFNQLA